VGDFYCSLSPERSQNALTRAVLALQLNHQAMDKLEKQVYNLLIRNKLTLATAESCTGGLVSNIITNASGSSRFFLLGIIAYSNQAKISLLKIPAAVIAKSGAVSAEVARLMAGSVRKLAKSDFGLGITGIAGPQGGSAAKPVGTVFIAVDSARKRICRRFRFKAGRLSVKKHAALKALELLKLCLKEN